MQHGKLLLALVGASVLLGALVSTATASRFEVSSQTNVALFRRIDFHGGLFGSVVCEVKLSGSFHTRSGTKTVNSLIGYTTEATILRCERGSATITQSSLPWHRRFRSFEGLLPNITGQSETATGVGWAVREAGGIQCTVANATPIGTYVLSSGTVTSAAVSGNARCRTRELGEFEGSLSGTETNVTNGSGARITVRLI